MRKVAFLLSLGAVCASILSGCKTKSKYKTPTTSFEKVSVALNGVESSFSNYKSSPRTTEVSKNRSIKRINQPNPSGALSDLAAIYTSYDAQGDSIGDLEYGQPPMIQFQCLKNTFETLGEDFSFGTKYIDSITGVSYFDPNTGIKQTGEESYKYDYVFTVSISLDIDANDLIIASVELDISLTQNSSTLQTNWYVEMVLDYEMEKEAPTYSLAMYSDNEESDLSYLEYGNTYGYYFVDMKDGRINEWRKFSYEVNKRMIKDDSHTSFADYVNEGNLKVQIGASKWYKNGQLRNISHPNTSKTRRFATALFDKLGLNTTDINAQSFINKESTQLDAIGESYQYLSEAAKEDLIYTFIIETDSHTQKNVKSSMHVMDYNVYNVITEITINEDITLKDLFNGEEGYYGIWYFDQNDEALEQVENLNELEFRLSIPYGSNNEEKVFDNSYLEAKFSDLYKTLGRDNFDAHHSIAILRIYDNLTLLNAIVSIHLSRAFETAMSEYYKAFFPDSLVALGLPLYEGDECIYDYRYRSSTQVEMDITKTTEEELEAYKAKLDKDNWSLMAKVNTDSYSKITDNKLRTLDIDSTNIEDDGKLRLTYSWQEIVKDSWPHDEILETSNNIFDLQAPVSKNGYFQVVSNEQEKKVVLKNFTEEERTTFIDTVLKSGNENKIIIPNYVEGAIDSLKVIYDNHVYIFSLKVRNNEVEFSYLASQEYHLYTISLMFAESPEDNPDPVNPDDGDNQNDPEQINKNEIAPEEVVYTKVADFIVDENYTSYFLIRELSPGIYKVKRHDLVDDTIADEYIQMVSTLSENTNVTYDNEELTLTVTAATRITFVVDIFSTTSVELRDAQ